MDPTLADGFKLTLIGMGVVFCFLVVLVIGTSFMSWFISRFSTDQSGVSDVSGQISEQQGQDSGARGKCHSDEIVAVIGAAISRFKGKS